MNNHIKKWYSRLISASGRLSNRIIKNKAAIVIGSILLTVVAAFSYDALSPIVPITRSNVRLQFDGDSLAAPKFTISDKFHSKGTEYHMLEVFSSFTNRSFSPGYIKEIRVFNQSLSGDVSCQILYHDQREIAPFSMRKIKFRILVRYLPTYDPGEIRYCHFYYIDNNDTQIGSTSIQVYTSLSRGRAQEDFKSQPDAQ